MNYAGRLHPGTPLIAIIGIDGAGKSTQISAVRENLAQRGHKVTELPNESLQALWQRLDTLARANGQDIEGFFGVDMIQMLASTIKWVTFEKAWRELEGTGGVLLSDRYSYCQMAAARRAGERTRAAIDHLYGEFPRPDVCVWIDTPPKIALERLGIRGGSWQDLSFLEVLRRGYCQLAGEHEFTVVNGDAPPAVVTGEIMLEIKRARPDLFPGEQ
jgi:dTMP kinase